MEPRRGGCRAHPIAIEAGKKKGEDRLKGTVGSGGGTVKLSSGSGDVGAEEVLTSCLARTGSLARLQHTQAPHEPVGADQREFVRAFRGHESDGGNTRVG